jgi:hypothetical protein
MRPSTHSNAPFRQSSLISVSFGSMISRSQKRIAAIAMLCAGASAPLVRADGLSSSYFVRFDSPDHSWTYFWTVLTIIMIANYALNFAVIGAPAILRAHAPPKSVALGLIILTILGQVADRIGAFAAVFVSVPIAAVLSPMFSSESHGLDTPAFIYSLVAANLICSGIAVGALAIWFLRKRWSVPKALSWKIALAAALLTNPAWVLLIPNR